MTTSIAKRLDAFRQLNRVQAGSLIISLFGDAILPRGGRIWLGSLIHLLTPLGLSERLIRTSVFRLAKEEWLRTEAHGRRADYLLTPSGLRRFEAASQHIYAAQAPLWDRRWRLIFIVGNIDIKAKERLRRALFWQGFGTLGADAYVHPSADLSHAFDALVNDGMSDVLEQLAPLIAAPTRFGPCATDIDLVQRAWNLDELAQSYRDFVTVYQPILEDLRMEHDHLHDDESMFLLRTLLIHDYRRLLLRDPELPDTLLPPNWPGQQARLICQELYRRLLTPSEAHLDRHMQWANGSTPTAAPSLLGRFRAEDLLDLPL